MAPPALVEAIVAAKQASDMGSAALDQLAFADVLARGELDRHLRRMRPIYRGRRDALLEALGRHLPDLEPVGASAGLHLLAWLPPGSDDGAIVAAAGRSGIGLGGMTARRIAPGPAGLIFGYGGIVAGAIDAGIRRLAEVMAVGGTAAPGPPRRGRLPR